MIRGVIFDCFGVLYGGSLDALMTVCPPERRTELRDLNHAADFGMITGDAYIAGLAELTGVSREGIEEIMHTRHIRNQQLIEYVESLRPHLKVGLLSNVSSGTIDPLFNPEDRARLFDATVLSYEEHIAKPHPEIYEIMAKRLGLLPEECIMVDDLASNCEGAEIAGMHSVLHSSNETTRYHIAKLIQENA